MERSGVVYVHCVHGQSRSCAVCIAYLITEYVNNGFSQRKCLSQKIAVGIGGADILHLCYDIVKSSRPCMAVNPGFVQQLEIFRRMKCIQKNQPLITWIHSNSHATFRAFRAKAQFYDSGKVTRFFPHTHAHSKSFETLLVCKKCNENLATDRNLVTELSRDEISLLPASDYWKDSSGGKDYVATKPMHSYSNESFEKMVHLNKNRFLLEPMEWMRQQMLNSDNQIESRGTLRCANCAQQLGGWDWCHPRPSISIVLMKAKLDFRTSVHFET